MSRSRSRSRADTYIRPQRVTAGVSYRCHVCPCMYAACRAAQPGWGQSEFNCSKVTRKRGIPRHGLRPPWQQRVRCIILLPLLLLPLPLPLTSKLFQHPASSIWRKNSSLLSSISSPLAEKLNTKKTHLSTDTAEHTQHANATSPSPTAPIFRRWPSPPATSPTTWWSSSSPPSSESGISPNNKHTQKRSSI